MARPSPDRKVERTFQKRDSHGHYRTVTESMTEVAYCAAIAREAKGWYRGARIASIPLSVQSEEIQP